MKVGTHRKIHQTCTEYVCVWVLTVTLYDMFHSCLLTYLWLLGCRGVSWSDEPRTCSATLTLTVLVSETCDVSSTPALLPASGLRATVDNIQHIQHTLHQVSHYSVSSGCNNNNNTIICKVHIVSIRAESEATTMYTEKYTVH